jgi:glutamyl-tRNA reductase
MGTPAIDLLVIGVSHRTAPVAVRERLAVEPEAVQAALVELATLPAVREAVMLNTCNRVELYVATGDAASAAKGIGDVLARRAGVAADALVEHLYQRQDAAAVHHLFRVASSLDSLVIGEPQILGQTKQAYDLAVQHGTAGSVLNSCFPRAFRVARRVRRETAIARNPVSVSSIAVDYARGVFSDFDKRHVLVVGAGKMSELAARTLRTHGATLTVTNRTRARADDLAKRFGAAVADWSDLVAALTTADIVIASTGAQRPVLTAAMLAEVRRARRGRPLCLLDIAVPRDVEPAAGQIDGIYLFDIDDLQKVAGEHRAEREDEATEAEQMVEQELGRFVRDWRGRQLGPTVSALRNHVFALAQAEVERVCSSLSHLSERDRLAIKNLADIIPKKLLHLPQMALRNDDPEGGFTLAAAVQALFALEVTVAAPPSEPKEGVDEERRAVGKKAAGS